MSNGLTNRQLSGTIKAWEKPVYECHGDYRNETFLEEYIGGKLYSKQKELPRLPIPSLDETIDRFLPTALPLAKTKQEAIDLIAACKLFPKQAKVLHDRLLERRDDEMKDSSWLQVWWNQVSREPRVWMHSISFCRKQILTFFVVILFVVPVGLFTSP